MSGSMDAILQWTPIDEDWETLDDASMELTRTSEFWNQVEYESDRMDFIPPLNFEEDPESEPDWSIAEPPEEVPKTENIVHHDCMWAGSCVDSGHPTNTFVPSDLVMTPGQSLLRRDMSPPRPDTPPSLDGDEPLQFRHAVDVTGTALKLIRESAAVAADHSYTFVARQQFDNLGVQTPSDSCESEEEIDVVSVGSSSQQTLSAGIPPFRTEHSVRHDRQMSQRATMAAITPRPAARKRLVPPPNIASCTPRRRARGSGRRGRRSNTDTDSEAEIPELERRSIHNDMERLRRIGLKNLFDELKKQIPATRDKERAPKVVILREAAKFCQRLREEEHQREVLRKQQNRLLARLKKLRVAVSARYRSY